MAVLLVGLVFSFERQLLADFVADRSECSFDNTASGIAIYAGSKRHANGSSENKIRTTHNYPRADLAAVAAAAAAVLSITGVGAQMQS